MASTPAVITRDAIRVWEQEQRSALREVGEASWMIARGAAVTVTRMDLPALREWAWLTDEWEGRAFGDLRGYVMADAEGRELGVILSRGRLVHGEWLNPTTGEYEFAGEVRTVKIAANYVMDRHDYLARVSGVPARVQDDEAVREQLVSAWMNRFVTVRPEPEPVEFGVEVVYDGSLEEHRGEVFTVHPHDHMFRIVDEDEVEECWCTGRFTLVNRSGHRALLHVSRGSFHPVA